MNFKPLAHQEKAIKFCLESYSSLLLLDMGLGKTVVTLTAIVELLDAGEIFFPLIVAPKIVSENQWASELLKWEHTKGLDFIEIDATSPKKRIEQARRIKPGKLTIVSESKLQWLMEFFAKERKGWDLVGDDLKAEVSKGKWVFDLVAIDEISLFKHGETNRFKALRRFLSPRTPTGKIRQGFNKPRVIGLTGTPTPSGAENLWSIMMLVDGGQRLGYSLAGFKKRYGVDAQRVDSAGRKYRVKEIRDSVLPKILNDIDDIALAMRASDWLESQPEVEYIRHKVNIGAFGMMMANEVIKWGMTNNMTQRGNEIIISADTVIEAMGKALQFTSGACYVSEAEGDLLEIANTRAIEKTEVKTVGAMQVKNEVRKLDRKYTNLSRKDKKRLHELEIKMIEDNIAIKMPRRFRKQNDDALEDYKRPKRLAHRKAKRRARELGMDMEAYKLNQYRDYYDERYQSRIDKLIQANTDITPMIEKNVEDACHKYAKRESTLDADGRVNTDNKLVLHCDDRKILALEELVLNIDAPVFVLYHYKHEFDRIRHIFPDAELLNTKTAGDIIPRWNKGKIPVLLANPKSTKFGLNMQDGGNNIIWFSIGFSYEEYVQTNARLARQGQLNKTYIHILEAENTIDERVMDRLSERNELNDQVFDVLNGKLDVVEATSYKDKLINDVKSQYYSR